jgi:hypothetical protein
MLLIIAGLASGAAAIWKGLDAIDEKRFPRSVYSSAIGWWWGAFVPDDACTTIAGLIDSDYNCEIWKQDSHYCYSRIPTLVSKSLKCRVLMNRKGRIELEINSKNDSILRPPVSAYDDYILNGAVKRWEKRAKYLKKKKLSSDTEAILTERITNGYIDTVEMIEKKILGKQDSTVANELRALLPPPEHPKENV